MLVRCTSDRPVDVPAAALEGVQPGAVVDVPEVVAAGLCRSALFEPVEPAAPSRPRPGRPTSRGVSKHG